MNYREAKDFAVLRNTDKDELVPVYENGQLLVDYTLEQVRVNASQCLHNFFTRAD
jgi:hypothetical protein